MEQKIFQRYYSFFWKVISIDLLGPIELIVYLPDIYDTLGTYISCSMIFFVRILQEK